MLQQEEPIDIFVAKIQNDLIEDQIFCHVHPEVLAVQLTTERQQLCQECTELLHQQSQGKIQTVDVKAYIEKTNLRFHQVSEKFIQIHQYYQEDFLVEILTFSLDERIQMFREQFDQAIQKIQEQKQSILQAIKIRNDQALYNEFKAYLDKILKNNQNYSQIDILLSDQKIKNINQLAQSLSENTEGVLGEIKHRSNELINQNIGAFNNWLDDYLKISSLKNQAQFNPSQLALTQSVVQRQQPPSQIEIKNEITQLKKIREQLKQAMETHIKQNKTALDHPKIKINGGGSFGYSFTGGYGVSSTAYEDLVLCESCIECRNLNFEMHNTCKRLYDLEFRDGLKWWVEAWFLFLK